MKMFKKWFTW